MYLPVLVCQLAYKTQTKKIPKHPTPYERARSPIYKESWDFPKSIQNSYLLNFFHYYQAINMSIYHRQAISCDISRLWGKFILP